MARMDASGITPGDSMPRFPGFDVLSLSGHWDQVTAGTVLSRLSLPTNLQFFTLSEEAVARPLLDALLAQDSEPRIPLLEMIDSRLAESQTDGWRYADLPEDRDAWKQSLHALDDDARGEHGIGFAECGPGQQEKLIQGVQDRGSDSWHGMRADRVWSLWTRYACTAFYSHPWAWNEIGFPGPAYPRGYKNAGIGQREPFEVPDGKPAADPTRETGS